MLSYLSNTWPRTERGSGICVCGEGVRVKKKKKNRWGKGKKEGKNAQSAAKYNIDKGWILMRLWNERWTQVLLPSPPPPSFSQGICVECIAQKYKQKGILMFWFLLYLSICQLYSIVGAEEEDGSARKKDITLTADGCLMGELWETLFWFSAVSWGAINISCIWERGKCLHEGTSKQLLQMLLSTLFDRAANALTNCNDCRLHDSFFVRLPFFSFFFPY